MQQQAHGPDYTWTMVGPGGGGHYSLAAVSADGSRFEVVVPPGDTDRLYVCCFGSSIWEGRQR